LGVVAGCVVFGCGAESTRTGTHTVAPSGPAELVVLDQIGDPVAGTDILVDGAIVTTDAFGHATTADLPPSYDLSLVVGGYAYAFIGLATRSPLIRLRASIVPEQSSYATVAVANPDSIRDDDRIFFMAGVSGLSADEQYVRLNSNGYEEVRWPGTSGMALATEAVLAELDDTQQNVLGYAAYAAETLAITPENYVTWNPTFGQVPFHTVPIHTSTDAPSEDTVFGYQTWLYEASGSSGENAFADGVTSADVPVLDIPDARYYVTATIGHESGTFVAEQYDVRAGATVRLESGRAPEQIAPESGATVDLATSFGWTPSPGAVYRLLVYTDDSVEPFVQYDVATSEPGAVLPDLSALGFAFPAGRKLAWAASCHRGYASLDAYASGGRSHGWGFSDYRLATAAGP
jgi:hypothetical protein